MSDGGPAFPQEATYYSHKDENDVVHFVMNDKPSGMSLRDYFAAKAMQGWLATYGDQEFPANRHCLSIAAHCYELADAMLEARKA